MPVSSSLQTEYAILLLAFPTINLWKQKPTKAKQISNATPDLFKMKTAKTTIQAYVQYNKA